MSAARRLVSTLDPSRNLVIPFGRGALESRLVIRGTAREKLCIYVSSQAGCNMGCGECHLTATGQTSMRK